MEQAKWHSTEDQTVIDLRISAESFVQDFSCLFPALSAFLLSVHADELWRLKREGGPEVLWTPRMEQLAAQLASVSTRWLEIANRKVRGKTAQTKWLLEVSRVLAEANALCTAILTAIIEAGIAGAPWWEPVGGTLSLQRRRGSRTCRCATATARLLASG